MLPNSTDWKEVFLDGSESAEEKLFQDFAREIEQQQEQHAPANAGHPMRGFHAKLHAGLRAEFIVLPDLPEDARHGVFHQPGRFDAVVRFSNGSPGIEKDSHPEPRGIAIKLFGVPGPKLLLGQEDAVTQDFLATSHSVTSTVRDVKQFMGFIRAARHGLTLPIILAREVGGSEAIRILTHFIQTVTLSKVRSVVTEHYSSTAPIQCGPYAIKFSVQPTEEASQVEAETDAESGPNFLRQELADCLRKGDILLDFYIQFFKNETLTPIEDTFVEWTPEDSPPIKVAQIRILSCDLEELETQKLSEIINTYSFTPWHTIPEHRPLGNIMRARKVAYGLSSQFRNAAPEPTSPPWTE